MSREDVLILGAGPAGMAAAFELHKGGRPFTVVERNECVGGLARTVRHGAFKTDIGPHGFFTRDSYLQDCITNLLGDRWVKMKRLSKFYIDGRYYSYPVEFKNAVLTLGPRRTLRITADYLFQRLRNCTSRRSMRSFEEDAIATFGRALAEFNILNYAEKIWGLPCSEISSDSSTIFFHGLSVGELIKNIIIRNRRGPRNLADHFYYPETGAGAIYESIKDLVMGEQGFFTFKSYPAEISHNGSRINRVVLGGEQVGRVINPGYVLSSIPVAEFVALLRPSPPSDVVCAAENLRFRSYRYLLLAVNKESVFPEQWVYFPDRQIPFSRLTGMGNYSSKLSPPGHTSILVEFFCWHGDSIWNADTKELFDTSIEWLERAGFVKHGDVVGCYKGRERYAYPIYTLGYRKELERVEGFLRNFKNLYSIGRSSCFRYDTQDQAMGAGISAAWSIMSGTSHKQASRGWGTVV